MKMLHEYNYNDLAECLYDFYFDIGKLRVFTGYMENLRINDESICVLHEILDNFDQHEHDFNSVFDRINNFAVPPEGVE